MPLLDIECENGHRSEVLKRGASQGPFACPTCGEVAKGLFPSAVTFVSVDPWVAPPDLLDKVSRHAPKVIKRAGSGKAVRTAEGGYRPMLTHTAKCPKCNRRRNVAIMNEVAAGVRPMCEACGYTWIHHAATASDPLLEGYDRELAPSQSFAGSFSGYQAPERGA